jgi:hypothetical protein
MKSKLVKLNGWQLTLAAVVITLVALLGWAAGQYQVALADSPNSNVVYLSPSAGNSNPGILPPHSKVHGKSYGEWSAAWWQWAYSLPVDQNPFFDETGCANGANGQSGSVWFLTGVINASGTAVRDCSVPVGKALFFPILNVECATLEGNGETEGELRACTESLMKLATNLAAEIDGVSIQNLENYRAASPLFTYGPLPENNVLQSFGYDAPAGATSLAVADGFYLMLAPLSKGAHTLHFTGRFLGEYNGSPIDFTLDITYHLIVGK